MEISKRIVAIVLGATCAAGALGCGDGEPDAISTAPPTTHTVERATTLFGLRTQLRRLWTDHVSWTRVLLVDEIAGLPDARIARARLFRNQRAIGATLEPFWGARTAKNLTILLENHVTGAAALVAAAKSGDVHETRLANAAWHSNAYELAKYLAEADPTLDRSDLERMMDGHLDRTFAEASARIAGDWDGDVDAYGAAVLHALSIADALARGIGAQFPERFVEGDASRGSDDLHLEMRRLWEDQATWTRSYVMSAVAGLPDQDPAFARLLQNEDDLGRALEPHDGARSAEQLTRLLRLHASITAEVVASVKEGDTQALARAEATWRENADAIAARLAGANPHLDAVDLRRMLRTHLAGIEAEAKDRLAGDWDADVAASDAVVEHLLEISDAIADGIEARFPDGPSTEPSRRQATLEER